MRQECRYCVQLDNSALLRHSEYLQFRASSELGVTSSGLKPAFAILFRITTQIVALLCQLTECACARINDATRFHVEAIEICHFILGHGTSPGRGLWSWRAEVGTYVKWCTEEILHSSLGLWRRYHDAVQNGDTNHPFTRRCVPEE